MTFRSKKSRDQKKIIKTFPKLIDLFNHRINTPYTLSYTPFSSLCLVKSELWVLQTLPLLNRLRLGSCICAFTEARDRKHYQLFNFPSPDLFPTEEVGH